MEKPLTAEQYGLDDVELLTAAIESNGELFFALAAARQLKRKGRFPIVNPEGLTAHIRESGGIMRTLGVTVREADVTHVPPVLFPITDGADFVKKISIVIRSVHRSRAARAHEERKRNAQAGASDAPGSGSSSTKMETNRS